MACWIVECCGRAILAVSKSAMFESSSLDLGCGDLRLTAAICSPFTQLTEVTTRCSVQAMAVPRVESAQGK